MTKNSTDGMHAIETAATQLFGARGYSGTTIRNIADRVGILPGSLYAHIKSKEDLLYQIIETGILRFQGFDKNSFNSPDSACSRLNRLILNHIAVVAEDPNRALVVFHQWRHLTGYMRESIIERRRQYESSITQIIEAGLVSGEFDPGVQVKITVKSILGSLNWTPEWYRPDGRGTPEKVAEDLANAVIYGLQSRKSEPL